MKAESTGIVEVFYSYAHEDELLRNKLEKHLSILKRQGIVADWHDREIAAGTEWAHEIDAHMNTAQIILLLVSADFLASDYCYSNEMKLAMSRHEAGAALVMPVILRSVDWEGAPFSKLQALPKDGKPVTSWRNRDEAFTDITRSIRKAIEKITTSHSVVLTPSASFVQKNSEKVLILPNIWNVPYRRNPFFTGREDSLKKMHDLLRADKIAILTQSQSIMGLGGIGKTQTAVEYAYRHRDNYQYVLWVNADSHEALYSDFVMIAGLLNLPKIEAQDQSLIVDAVKHWLEMNTGWLLILDNADDLTMVYEFFPSINKGHILLTTRSQAKGTFARSIMLEEMQLEEGALFLLHRAKIIAQQAPIELASSVDRATAVEIVREMNGLPFALEQAGVYIEETQCGLSKYLVLFRQHRVAQLKRRGRLTSDHPEPFAATWSLSFQKVESANPAAADLLRFFSLLSPDVIPEEIITEGASDFGRTLQSLAIEPFELDAAVEVLRKYSLLRRNPEARSFSIHRLVQTIVRDGMNKHTLHQWANRVIQAVERIFPPVTVATWPICQRYLPQALVCATLIDEWDIDSQESARLLHQAGFYLTERARYSEAELLLQRAVAINERRLGSGHPETAMMLNTLAMLYHNQGKYEQAVLLFQRAIAIKEQVLGPEDPETATSLNNLASLYESLGEYAQAEHLLVQALAIREKVLGPLHPETATSLNDLAVLYERQGKYEVAEPLYQRALAIREQILGSEHPNVATSLHNLALMYENQGNYQQAESSLLQALEIWERTLGPEHPNIATSLNNLALLYERQGKYQQAESFLQRALMIREKVLGPEHPNVATSLNNLALLYERQGKEDQAKPLFQRALTIREQTR